MLFEKPKKEPALTNLDKLFIDYIENITEETDKAYEIYDFNTPSLSLRKFLWDTFASNYIELIKNRAYNQQNNFTKEESSSAKYTLHFLLERLLLLLYPIIPQSTTTIAGIKDINLLKSEWPSAKKTKSNLSLIDSIIDFNSKVWKTKKEKGISLKDPLESISIPRELSPFEKDLKACHSI